MISKASQLQHVCIGEWSNAHFRGYIGVWLFRTDMTRVWSEIWTFPWASLPIMDSRTFFVKYLLFHTKQLVIERDKDYLKKKLTLFVLAKRIMDYAGRGQITPTPPFWTNLPIKSSRWSKMGWVSYREWPIIPAIPPHCVISITTQTLHAIRFLIRN